MRSPIIRDMRFTSGGINMKYKVTMTSYTSDSSTGHGKNICVCNDMDTAILIKCALELITVPTKTVYGFDNVKRSYKVQFDIEPEND